jgi:hypothetical protein
MHGVLLDKQQGFPVHAHSQHTLAQTHLPLLHYGHAALCSYCTAWRRLAKAVTASIAAEQHGSNCLPMACMSATQRSKTLPCVLGACTDS